MKLNGWHRLWILLSAVYFILVISYVILEFPKAENILHQSEFYKSLSKKSAGMIWPTTHDDALALGSDWIPDEVRLSTTKNKDVNLKPRKDSKQEHGPWEDYQKALQKEWDNAKSLDFHPIVEMPNKYTIEFRKTITKEEMETVSREYWQIIERKATEKRLYLVFYAFLFWILPCLVLYALGWSINWVYVGFKRKKDAQQ